MNLDISSVPEAAQLARMPASLPQRSPGRAAAPTPGRLAGMVQAALAEPSRWWHLVRFDPERPVHLRLESAPGCELWLTSTPPGHRSAPHTGGTGCEVLTVVAGELAERAITVDGAAIRPLRPGRIRVHGEGDLHEVINPGGGYAVSLCAHTARPD
jgi:Cysteine dioxygenase type I